MTALDPRLELIFRDCSRVKSRYDIVAALDSSLELVFRGCSRPESRADALLL